jgi:hypothetical protein
LNNVQTSEHPSAKRSGAGDLARTFDHGTGRSSNNPSVSHRNSSLGFSKGLTSAVVFGYEDLVLLLLANRHHKTPLYHVTRAYIPQHHEAEHTQDEKGVDSLEEMDLTMK